MSYSTLTCVAGISLISFLGLALDSSTSSLRVVVRTENLPLNFRADWNKCGVTAKLLTDTEFLGVINGKLLEPTRQVYLVGVFDFPDHSTRNERTNFHIQVELDGIRLKPFKISIPPEVGPHRVPFAVTVDFFLPPNLKAKREGMAALIPGKELVFFIHEDTP